MNFDKNEIINMIIRRKINSKNNNYIIAGKDSKSILDTIPSISFASFIEDSTKNELVFNIKIDLNKIQIQDIFKCVISYFQTIGKLDMEIKHHISFDNKIDVWRFDHLLKKYNLYVQLIFYNVEILTIEEQKLFNELYYYFSYNFYLISLIKNHFNSYFLENNRVLDDREDYQRFVLKKSGIKCNGRNFDRYC